VILACALEAAPIKPTTPHNINPRRNPREHMQARMIFHPFRKLPRRAGRTKAAWLGEWSSDRSGHPRTGGGSNLAAKSASCK
jgi:hypothetical protein